jgi:hypothetical protein
MPIWLLTATPGPRGSLLTMTRLSTLVWIDARGAVIVRWRGYRALVEREESTVPGHHRATGHVRHDPAVRHGGGGAHQTADEPHRLEHLERFVEQIASRLPADDDLVILGPGIVREQLERRIRQTDERHHRSRDISCEASPRLTNRQLIARIRHAAGADPLRRTVGAYRWTDSATGRGSDRAQRLPRRVVDKPPRRLDQGGTS